MDAPFAWSAEKSYSSLKRKSKRSFVIMIAGWPGGQSTEKKET